MLENHTHPMLRNRQIPIIQSPPSIIPVPVDEPSGPPYHPESPVQQPETQSAQQIAQQSAQQPTPQPVALPIPAPPLPKLKPAPSPSPIPGINPSTLVTCILVNFKTKRLTKQSLTTFLNYYPSVKVLLIDNGSHDDSTSLVRQAGVVYPGVTSTIHDINIGHGPAMHEAIMQAKTDYVFTLDSDCIIQRQGFLERMLKEARDKSLYAIGWRRWVDKVSGVPLEWHATGAPNRSKFIPYVHPCAGLYNVRMYKQLYGFTHHGAPCIINMREAAEKGFKVQPFPIFDYIKHLKAGTRRMYAGRWDPSTGDRPGPWNEDQDWPI